MGMITYTFGVPDTPNDPSFDQPNMKTNNDNLPLYLSVDHVPFNVNNSGYHTVIHQQLQGADPVTIANVNQVYAKNYTITNSAGSFTDTQLYTKTGQGGISQLTGNSASTNGFQFIGGVILQWGVVLNPGSSGTVTFNTAPNFNFPTACFNVSLTQRRDGSSSTQGMYLNGVPSQTEFKYNGSSSSDEALYWIAIGY